MGFVCCNTDGTNVVLGHTATTAQQRQYPFWICVVAAANVQLEPNRIVKSGAMVITRTFTRAVIQHVFCLWHFGAMDANKCSGDVFSRHRFEQLCTQCTIFIFDFDGCQKCFEKTFMVLGADICSSRDFNPVSLNLRAAQHRFNALAALIGHDENCGPLTTRTPGASRPVLKPFGIAWQFDVNHQ